MMQRLRQGMEKFDALTLRERAIVALMIVVVLVIAWSELLMTAISSKQKSLQSQITNAQTQTAANRKQITILKSGAQQDPDRENKQRLKQLQQQLAALDEQLKEKMRGLIDPAQMTKVLELVLTQKTDLRLLRVQNLPTRPLLEAVDDEKQNKTEVGVYRHGMQIEFSGSYLSTLDYLKALDELHWDFYWDGLTLEVEKYPKARIVITVHTLSLKEGWIGV